MLYFNLWFWDFLVRGYYLFMQGFLFLLYQFRFSWKVRMFLLFKKEKMDNNMFFSWNQGYLCHLTVPFTNLHCIVCKSLRAQACLLTALRNIHVKSCTSGYSLPTLDNLSWYLVPCVQLGPLSTLCPACT